ncbi:MAG: hypothetical protein RL660_2058 [Bacteroidota bacterium]|jgi:hypothetical protein
MKFSIYFQSYSNYFWQWEDDGDVAAIPGGRTIGYRLQIGELLSQIAVCGLPPFGSFLLALTAMTDNKDNTLQIAEQVIAKHCPSDKNNIIHDIEKAFAFLYIIQQLPKEYKEGKRKAILLRTIFESSHRAIKPSKGRVIAQTLIRDSNSNQTHLQKVPFSSTNLQNDIRTLALLLRRFPDGQSIQNAMARLPELEELEIAELESQTPLDTNNANFVDELIANPKTFEVGSLIKPIWAGFKVPIFTSHPSEQPLGGISDLSNKGNFDKLLVSEFANDDLIFMSRIANNEALYLHREMPPIIDKLERIILVDTSLKAWGTPKTLAYATYLAIALHPKSRIETKAFSVGHYYRELQHSTIGQVIDGLQNVDLCLYPSTGLEAFLDEYYLDKKLEIFFITNPNSLKQASIQKLLADNRNLFKYIVTTNADGEINFYSNKLSGQKHLQTIKPPLSSIWQSKTTTPKQTASNNDVAILQSYPILFPTPSKIKKKLLLSSDEVYIVANKCLFKKIETPENYFQGWQLLLQDIHGNSKYEIGQTLNGEIQFLCYNINNKQLKIYNLTTGDTGTTDFTIYIENHYTEFTFHDWAFMKIFGGEAYWISLQSGEISIKRVESKLPIYDIYHERKRTHDYYNNFKHVSCLVKVNDIFINQNGNLVFNKHELQYTREADFHFSSYKKIQHTRTAAATKTGSYSEYVFKDGSSITISSNGLATLISSDTSLPYIYLTTCIGSSVGLSTSDVFAGNLAYHCNSAETVQVQLKDAGSDSTKAAKIISTYTRITLDEANSIVSGTTTVISQKQNLSVAQKMIEHLAAINAVATIVSSSQNQQKVISSLDFHEQYLYKFINTIIKHETAT